MKQPVLTPNEREIVAACRRRESDLYGDDVIRVTRLIDAQAGTPLCEMAQWIVIIDLVRKLTHLIPHENCIL